MFTDPSGYASMLSHSAATNSYFQLMRTVVPSVAATAISRALLGAVIRGGAFAIRQELKKCIKPVGKQKCRLMIPILVSGNDFPIQRKHIWDAQTGFGENINGRAIIPVLKYQRSKINRKSWPKGKSPKGLASCELDEEDFATYFYQDEVECDEYPFSASKQGGYKNYQRNRVSARYIAKSDNQGFGWRGGPQSYLRTLKPGTRYIVAAFSWVPASVFFKPKHSKLLLGWF